MSETASFFYNSPIFILAGNQYFLLLAKATSKSITGTYTIIFSGGRGV